MREVYYGGDIYPINGGPLVEAVKQFVEALAYDKKAGNSAIAPPNKGDTIQVRDGMDDDWYDITV